MTQSRLTRLQKLEEDLDPMAALLKTDGLCALIQAAQQLPERAPGDEEEAPLTSFGLLLQQAKQWLTEQEP
jgi:hypothetical protein